MNKSNKESQTDQVDFNTFCIEDVNEANLKNLTPEQQRILKLEKRVADLEEQMLGCLRWMRHQAEKEANDKDPSYPVHKTFKA